MEKFLIGVIKAVVESFMHNWIPLSLAIFTAAILSVYVDGQKLKDALTRRTNVSISASVAFGAFTPFCACGTMAVIIGMLTTALPWGPIMAFLTSSPLMSPDGFILLAGIISLKFAIALTVASVVIGLFSGYITHFIEKKSDFLKNRIRTFKNAGVGTDDFKAEKGNQAITGEACNCSNQIAVTNPQSCCSLNDKQGDSACTSGGNELISKNNRLIHFLRSVKWREIAKGLKNIGLKQIIPNFALFVAIGYLVNYFIPTSLIITLFSAKNIFAVPLAALIGLPLYVNGESAIPLIKALLSGGAGDGAILAFMITGPGTSAWVIAGITTFMRKKVIILYLLYILLGGITLGYLYDFLIMIGL